MKKQLILIFAILLQGLATQGFAKTDKPQAAPSHLDVLAEADSLVAAHMYDEALSYLETHAEAQRKNDGKNASTYAMTLNKIGSIYLEMSQPKKALQYFSSAEKIWHNTRNNQQIGHADVQHNMGLAYYQLRMYIKAIASFDEAAFFKKRILGYDHPSYAQSIGYIALCYQDMNKPVQAVPYVREYLEYLRERVLLQLDNKTPEEVHSIREKYQQLIDRVLAVTISAVEQGDTENADLIFDLCILRQELLMGTDLKYRWQDVQQALTPHSVAIEFASSSRIAGQYIALVLRNTRMPQVVIVSEDDRAIRDAIAASNKNQAFSRPVMGKIVWGKILPHLHAGDTVYFTPTSTLAQLSIENLTIGHNTRFCDQFVPRRLSSSRQIITKKPWQQLNNVTLFGDINYSCDIDQVVTAHRDNQLQPSLLTNRAISFLIRNEEWANKPDTKQELEKITDALTKKEVPFTLYTGHEAVETAFLKQAALQPQVLHLATYSFSTPAPETGLLRTGVVFAGVNTLRSQMSTLMGDGFLTAEDIAQTDLHGTQLVVLTASPKAIGNNATEGFADLQRAFKMAGVEHLIVPLWDVPSEVTTAMMVAFYKALAEGEEVHAAFARAQQSIQKKTFKINGESCSGANPDIWAAFILLE